jgi:hypothetical protein
VKGEGLTVVAVIAKGEGASGVVAISNHLVKGGWAPKIAIRDNLNLAECPAALFKGLKAGKPGVSGVFKVGGVVGGWHLIYSKTLNGGGAGALCGGR